MKQWTTTQDFINNGKIPASATAGFIVQTEGYSSKGDGGGAQWRFTGVTGQAPSQTPTQLGDAKLTDASGNEFKLSSFIKRDVALGTNGLIPFNAFQESNPQNNKAQSILEDSNSGNHAGEAWSAKAIQFNPEGSGQNGPDSADIGLGITVIKKNWTNGAVNSQGEIDGLQIVTRCGGPGGTKNDSNGIMVNSQCIDGTGFVAGCEMESSTIDPNTFQIVRRARFQSAPLDEETLNLAGAFVIAEGDFDEFLRFQQSAGSTVDFLFKHINSNGPQFAVTGDGKIYLYQDDGSTYSILSNEGGATSISDQVGVQKFIVNTIANRATFNVRSVSGIGHTVAPNGSAPGPLEAGLIATDDGSNWSGVNATGSPRPVFYDGTSWVAMT